MTIAKSKLQETRTPRRLALEILNGLETSDLTLDRLIEDGLQAHPFMDSRDRGFLNALVYGVLRWRGRLDWILAHFARQRPEAQIGRAHV